jgi:hypothetical protein
VGLPSGGILQFPVFKASTCLEMFPHNFSSIYETTSGKNVAGNFNASPSLNESEGPSEIPLLHDLTDNDCRTVAFQSVS